MIVSGISELIMIVITMILLVVALTYMFRVKASNEDEKTKKDKYVKGMMIGSTVVLSITMIIGIWHLLVSAKINKCIKGE